MALAAKAPNSILVGNCVTRTRRPQCSPIRTTFPEPAKLLFGFTKRNESGTLNK